MRAWIMAVLLAICVVPARADDLSAVVDRYVAWRGGAAFEGLQSVHLKGALDAAGLHGTEETCADSAGRVRVDDDLGVLKQTQVVAAGNSWDTATSGQVETLPVTDRQSIGRIQALQFADTLRGGRGATAKLAGNEARDGRAWAVVRVSFGDDDIYDAFIDPQTGALGGFRITEDREGRFEGFDDWRMVDGVRIPFLHTTKTDAPGGDATVKIASVELNKSLPAGLLTRPAPVRKAVFKNGASSTGWIDFDLFTGNRIYFPAKVNGHEVVVLLDSGASVSSIDKVFATSLGLTSKGAFSAPGAGGIDTTGFINGIEIQIGNLTLHNVNVAAFDFAPVARRIGHPTPFVLGDELFNELAVDIDFAHHRIAFRDPDSLTKPAGAVEVPLVRVKGNRSVPVSVEGAVPAQFDFDLGAGAPLDVSPAYYRPHKLLEGRRASQTLGGGIGGAHPEAMALLSRVMFAGVEFHQVPTIFTPDTMSASNSNLVVGTVGLPVYARFHLIIDYSHDRLYAAPYADAANMPFRKDRLGLFLVKQDDGLAVEFVAPGSPAEAAGLKIGDKIVLIDGKAAEAWKESDLATLRFTAVGRTLAFKMTDGAVRNVVMADFF